MLFRLLTLLFICCFGSCTQNAIHSGDAPLATFQVSGNTAYISGIIYSRTPAMLKALIKRYPNIDTIVFRKVPGSISDRKNLKAGRIIRSQQLTTLLNDSSVVASGGTDLFLAGCQRIIEGHPKIGVHAWSGNKVPAAALPKNHQEHLLYLNYYREMGIDTSFYWFTLQAAPAHHIYWMTSDELVKYHFTTKSCKFE
jgi:hypothetical protein